MDSEGYIEINLIASFSRVRALTIDLGLVRDTLLLSPVLEVQGMKVRRRQDWERWLLPHDTSVPRAASASPPPSSVATATSIPTPQTDAGDDHESTTTAVATATYTNPSELGASSGPPPAVTSEIPLPESASGGTTVT